jgi:hypothetical protein
MNQETPTLIIRGRHFIHRWINCGKCKACRAGRPHGPYFYERILNRRGKWIERYVGVSLPPAIAAAAQKIHFRPMRSRRGKIDPPKKSRRSTSCKK